PRAGGGCVRVGFDGRVIGDEHDGLEQVVDAFLLLGRYRHNHRLAAPFVGGGVNVGERLFHPVGVGVRLVDFVEGDDDWHTRRFGVGGGLTSLGHHAVVGG